jgi:hypothetical protein
MYCFSLLIIHKKEERDLTEIAAYVPFYIIYFFKFPKGELFHHGRALDICIY